MKKIIVIAGIILMGLGSLVHADTSTNQKDFYYVFHLYYDTGKLVADRDFKFTYDIIPGVYTADPVTTQFPYRGEVINFNGAVAGNFSFDPKQGNPQFTKGKISIKAPYVADAQKVVFYDNQNQPLLTVPVSDSSFCNDDGICNADRGEDSLSCPKDCKQQTLPVPVATIPASTSPVGGSDGLVSGIIYTIIGIVLLGVLWWILKRRGGSNNMTLPPSLPTPPAPPGSNNPV